MNNKIQALVASMADLEGWSDNIASGFKYDLNRLFVELYEKVLQVTPLNYGEGETFTKLSDVLDAFKDFGVEFPTSPQGEQQ